MDDKTLGQFKVTLTDTYTKAKFGELSEPFEMRTDVRHGDGISLLLFNRTLEKVVGERS